LIGSSVVVRGRGAFHHVPEAVRRGLPLKDQVRERESLEQLVDDARDDLRDRGRNSATAAARAFEERALRIETDSTRAEPLTEAPGLAVLLDRGLVLSAVRELLAQALGDVLLHPVVRF
jgi:hypothetical protein